ncbi:MAG: histidine kinase, partial [Stutzerimonas stutzeri]
MSIRNFINFGGHSAEAEAVRRSQAVIEFEPSGKIISANALFLDCIGYSLGEIEGQHHSMFVDTAERNSAAYNAFWS